MDEVHDTAAVFSEKKPDCDCVPLCELTLAHAYVPIQKYIEKYTPAETLVAGTYFRQLDMPYTRPGRCAR